MTLVMLPIGRSVFMPRLHITAPLAALARAPPSACTPWGARLSAAAWAPGAAVAATAAGAAATGARSSAPARARTLKRAGRCMALLS